MRKKTLIICLFITIASIAFSKCQAVETQYKPKVQFSKHIDLEPQNKDRQLRDIEARGMRQQQFIENYYQQRFEQLQLLAEREANKLEHPERMLWGEFVKLMTETPSANRYFFIPSFLESRTFKLRAAMRDTYATYQLRNFLLDENAREIIAHVAHNHKYTQKDRHNFKYYNSLLHEKAHEILVIMDKLQPQLVILEKQLDNSLANLEQWKNDQAEFILRTTNQTKVKAKAPGTVTAVLYDNKYRFAMINGKLVREADTIKGVKVIKIHADNVEFKKNRKTWTQKLGQTPTEFWQ